MCTDYLSVSERRKQRGQTSGSPLRREVIRKPRTFTSGGEGSPYLQTNNAGDPFSVETTPACCSK